MIPALLLAAACGGEQQTAEELAYLPPPAAPEPERVEPRRVLASSQIYYDLTRFDWYARGEPLLHDGAAFQPAGTPVAVDLDEMESVGDYQGVDVYRRAGDDQSLYVPVYDGYWLAFRPEVPAARAD